MSGQDQDDDSEGPRSWTEVSERQDSYASRQAEERWNETGNPLYVWEYLRSLFISRTLAELDGQMPEKVPIPAWVAEHLQGVAWRLLELADERDWRDFPEDDRTLDRIRAYRASHPVDAKQAASLTALSLGLTAERGWNAFAAWRSRGRSETARFMMEELREGDMRAPPMSARDAREYAMRLFGFTDERAFARFVAKSKSRAKPPR